LNPHQSGDVTRNSPFSKFWLPKNCLNYYLKEHTLSGDVSCSLSPLFLLAKENPVFDCQLNLIFLTALPEAWRLRVEHLGFAEALEHF
jgi:hypothetical protein